MFPGYQQPQPGYQPAPGYAPAPQQAPWMPAPTTIPGCPPGLEYLTQVAILLLESLDTYLLCNIIIA